MFRSWRTGWALCTWRLSAAESFPLITLLRISTAEGRFFERELPERVGGILVERNHPNAV
jgi:hypothetical protein